MYNIIFYQDKKGHSGVKEFIHYLNKKAKTDKNCNIQFNKIVAYFDLLEELGTRVGKPVTKHLEGVIWELD